MCVRCGEQLADSGRTCGFCVGERRREAVVALVAAAGSSDNASLLARVDAIDTLRNLGHSQTEVLRARAGALDGYSVDQILKGLEADVEAVAA